MTTAFAMIMAGGSSEDLSVLTEVRAEPATPFGGKFRLIDFPLSNCVNSSIYNVAVLTQYRPRSLNDHIGIGKPWDLDRASGGVRLLQPYRGGPYGDWQTGTADAVRRNLDWVLLQSEEHVLILAGDHIYLMDYGPMLRQHVESGADLTVAVRRVNPYETHRYGIVSVGSENRIDGFQEKPKRTRETLASMGIYIFRKDMLVEVLDDTEYVEFGKDVLPAMLDGRLRRLRLCVPGLLGGRGHGAGILGGQRESVGGGPGAGSVQSRNGWCTRAARSGRLPRSGRTRRWTGICCRTGVAWMAWCSAACCRRGYMWRRARWCATA